MADNTFNFDLDAPAVPTLTLDPAPAAEEKAAPVQQEAPAPEAQVNLTPEEQAMVDQFAEKCCSTALPARKRSAISPRLRSPRCPPRIWARWAT